MTCAPSGSDELRKGYLCQQVVMHFRTSELELDFRHSATTKNLIVSQSLPTDINDTVLGQDFRGRQEEAGVTT